MDLHIFGFRPDLTRRPRDSMMSSENDQFRTTSESVALDTAHILDGKPLNGGPLSEFILDSFHFFNVAYSASEPLAEYLLAGLCYGRKTDSLIVSTLHAIYSAPTGWGGNETLGAAIMVRFALVFCVPLDFSGLTLVFTFYEGAESPCGYAR